MKGFTRENLWLSLCGLNCGLCPMRLGGYCPGCGGGAGNQACAIARCSLAHDRVQYCFQCAQFPCEKYRDIDAFDSFITHQNRMRDFERARELGMKGYSAQQAKKREILKHLLAHYNDGRRKTLYCLAANLLELGDLEAVAARLAREAAPDSNSPKERAALAAGLLQEAAAREGLVLKLRKKPGKK